MLILSLGVLLCSSALAQGRQSLADLQPMKINQTVNAVFPRNLADAGVTRGACQVAIYVDASGKLAEWLVVKYTAREFGAAAVAALQSWTYEPARVDGVPVGSTLDLVFSYEAQGVVVSMTNLSQIVDLMVMQMRTTDRYVYQPCSGDELDRVPVATVTVKPQYPRSLAEKGIRGRVTVEYYIDETGAVRMPCVSVEDNPILASLTIAAVSQWKFEPPTSHGRPVLIKATQEFNFKGDNS